MPKEISFKTSREIALEQLRWACESGLPRGVVLMDAGYGADTDVRANITTLGLSYVAGIMPNTTVWAPGTGPLPPKKWSGQGRPPKLIRRDTRHGQKLGQGTGAGLACERLAHDQMARRPRPIGYPHASHACEFELRIVITISPNDASAQRTKKNSSRMVATDGWL